MMLTLSQILRVPSISSLFLVLFLNIFIIIFTTALCACAYVIMTLRTWARRRVAIIIDPIYTSIKIIS